MDENTWIPDYKSLFISNLLCKIIEKNNKHIIQISGMYNNKIFKYETERLTNGYIFDIEMSFHEYKKRDITKFGIYCNEIGINITNEQYKNILIHVIEDIIKTFDELIENYKPNIKINAQEYLDKKYKEDIDKFRPDTPLPYMYIIKSLTCDMIIKNI